MAVTVSLRLLTVAVVTLTVLVVTSITLGVTISVTTASLRRFGTRHARAISDSAVFQITNYFEVPSITTNMLQNASRMRPFTPLLYSPLDVRRWSDATWMGLLKNPSCSIVRTQFVEGSMVDAEHNVDSVRTTYPYSFVINFNVGQVALYAQPYNFSSNVTVTYAHYTADLVHNYTDSSNGPDDSFGTSLATLYAASFGGRTTLWGGLPYLAYYGNIMILFTGIGGPMRDRSGLLNGYALIPLPYYKLSDFLSEIRGTPSSYGFVIDALGYILATSCPIPYETRATVYANESVPVGCSTTQSVGSLNSRLSEDSQRQRLCRTKASEYGYAPLRAVASDQALFTAVDMTAAYMTIDGAGYFVVSGLVPMRYPNNVLQFVMTMPEVEVVGDLDTPRNLAIGVSVGVMVGACGIVVAVVSLLMRSVSNVVDSLESSSAFESKASLSSSSSSGDARHSVSGPHAWSWAKEVQTVEAAYAAMRQELHRISAFVPSALQSTPSTGSNDAIAPAPPSDDTLLMDLGLSPGVNPLSLPLPTLTHVPYSDKPKKKRVRFPQQQDLLEWVAQQSTLKTAVVAVLVADVMRFSDVVSGARDSYLSLPASRIVSAVRAITMQARCAVQLHGGVIDSFNGDHIVASFNTSRPVDRPARRAILAGLDLVEGRAATAIADRLFESASGYGGSSALSTGESRRPSDNVAEDVPSGRVSNDDWMLEINNTIRWRVGAASGRAIVGIAGSWDVEGHHVIGAVRAQAEALVRLHKVYRQTGVLISEAMLGDCDEAQQAIRVLGLARLQAEQERPSVVAAVRSGSSDTDRLQKLWNAAFILQASGRHDEATVVMSTHSVEAKIASHDWYRSQIVFNSDVPTLQQLCPEALSTLLEAAKSRSGLAHLLLTMLPCLRRDIFNIVQMM